MTCKFFKYVSKAEAECKSIHYPDDLLDPEHYEVHCKYNDISNRTDCVYYPERTEHDVCPQCKRYLHASEVYCTGCGRRNVD